jgi:hypothetical protein
MSIRFAASRPPGPLRDGCAASVQPLAGANDNAVPTQFDALGDTLSGDALPAALRHFAAHGLGAARQAMEAAERAARHGDEQGCARWREICRVLDQRMAEDLDRLLARR